jgi:hypothetical protein
MPERLKQLIYVSTPTDDHPETLSAILASAQKHDAANGITGMLLYAEGSFLQVLEGPPEAVDATYARIQQDPRHKRTLVMSEHAVPQREFGDWRMGFHALSAADAERFPDHARWFRYGFQPEAIQAQPGLALELLRLFASGVR